jgi:hypothetical protein
MKPETRRCKCLHCEELFLPDYRNRNRQQFCSKAECRQASKRARQQRWLSKPANANYFRDADNVERVRQWRQAHPGYWKRHPRKAVRTLQDACSAQPVAAEQVAPVPLQAACLSTLQDVCQVQVPLLVGIVSKFTDCTQQDDIVLYVRGLIAKGQDILDQPSSRSAKQNTYDEQKDPAPGPVAASAGAV